jgi:hypothetical protein
MGSLVLSAQQPVLPPGIANDLERQFPGNKNSSWYVESDRYVIEFEMKNDAYTMVYSSEGEWLETARVIADSDLTVEVTSTLKRTYPSGKISYAESVQNKAKQSFYRVNLFVGEIDYIIDMAADGKIIREQELMPFGTDTPMGS